MGRDVDLGKSVREDEKPKQEKLIFMNVSTTIQLMVDIFHTPNCSRYIEAFSNSIEKSLSKKEIRKEILKLYGIKTVKKFLVQRPKETDTLINIFGKGILGD